MIRIWRFLATGIVLVSTCWPGASAQEALSLNESQPEGPLVSADEVKGLVRIVGLEPDQAEAAATLREGLDADFQSAVRRRQKAWDRIQSDAQDHPQADQSKVYEDAAHGFRNRCAEIERAFLGDILGILTEEQAAKWPDFERFRRRVHGKGWWQRPASDVDLVSIIDGLGLEAAQAGAVRGLLDEYERELDPAVIARMAAKRGGIEIDFSTDYVKRQEWYSRAYDQTQQLDQRIAGVNRKYARLIAPLLPTDQHERFQTRFAEACYINLYTPSEDRKRIDAAEKLADLTDHQRARLREVLDPFRRNIAVVEREAERLEDEQAYQYSHEKVSEGKGPKGFNERYNDIWSQEAKALAAIREVLTEAQAEQIDAATKEGG